jgi:DNA segregation ATPase FtsK/SpoIIIE, S-DNA-T family
MPFTLFAPRRPQPSAAASCPEAPATGGAAPAGRRAIHYAREAAALLLFASALYWVLALGSFRGDPLRLEIAGPDWVGPVGAECAAFAVSAVGVIAWFIPFELALLAGPLLKGQRSVASVARIGGDVVVVAVLAALAHVAFPRATAFGAMPLGGRVGELFGEVLRALFSTIGSYIIGLTVVALILIGRAAFSFIEWTQRVQSVAAALGRRVAGWLRALVGAWVTAREIDENRREEARRAAEPIIARPSGADAIIAALTDEERDPGAPASSPMELQISGADAGWSDAMLPIDAQPTPKPKRARRAVQAPAASSRAAAQPIEERAIEPPIEDVPTPSPILPIETLSTEPANEGGRDAVSPAEAGATADRAEAPGAPRGRRSAVRAPKIVDTSAALVAQKAEVVHVVPALGEGFRLPSPELLEPAAGDRVVVDEAQLKESAVLLEKTLADYGVSGKVEEIHPGPTVTTFEVSPAAGTKVSKVASLADDLALGLSRKVRIIAPIPGKNRIGFEIPNEQRVAVNLRELVEDRRFVEMKAPLPCVLGRDIIGAPYFADLSSMPHVIVAGATGAGKSVGLNVMLVSLLCRRTPDELRLLMIDPKVVELAPFDRIPHMLLPVVTDMKQAANALKWAVDEMERRYQLFANAGTKNITTYNGWVDRVARGEAKPPKPPAKVAAVAPDGTEVEVDAAKDGSDGTLPERIPYIVIVVDEFADLMMQQGKDVEASVARLAQKARAAGMHVILATQRPSVDVITGMIKANFPTRIAFRVAQKVDSRTILDEQGAEHLLGRGDMLIKMNGSNETRRVQCPFCSEEEVQRVVDFLRLQGEPVYDEAIIKPRDDEAEDADSSDAEADPLYDAAVRIIADTRRCSTSWIQRKLGVGYNRAAKLVEAMEKRGLVGPANGAKDREVLIAPI